MSRIVRELGLNHQRRKGHDETMGNSRVGIVAKLTGRLASAGSTPVDTTEVQTKKNNREKLIKAEQLRLARVKEEIASSCVSGAQIESGGLYASSGAKREKVFSLKDTYDSSGSINGNISLTHLVFVGESLLGVVMYHDLNGEMVKTAVKRLPFGASAVKDDGELRVAPVSNIASHKFNGFGNEDVTQRTVNIGHDFKDVFEDDKYVSGRHCGITIYKNGDLTVKDYSSTNGTMVLDPTMWEDKALFGARELRGMITYLQEVPEMWSAQPSYDK